MPSLLRDLGTPLLLLAGTVLVVWSAAAVQRKRYITQYLYFVRFPIVFGCLLVAFPWTAPRMAPEMLGNLFVMGTGAVAIATASGQLCAWAIVYTCMLLWRSVPFRAELTLTKAQHIKELRGEAVAPPTAHPLTWRGLLFGLLLAASFTFKLIRSVDGSRTEAALAAAAGIAAALVIVIVIRVVERSVPYKWDMSAIADEKSRWREISLINPFVAHPLPRPSDTSSRRYAPDAWKAYVMMHRRSLVFFLVAVLLYGFVGWALRPVDASGPGSNTPALVYLFALFAVLIWVLEFLSFFFDKYRVPILSLVVVAVLTAKAFWSSDYEYQTQEWPSATEIPDLRHVLNSFASSRNGDVIVVAASGGGISAALWSTVVLRGLGERFADTLDVHRHVAMISSVSGGSVGSMYYVNAFDSLHGPRSRMDSVVSASGVSSLSSTVWGLAYLDFFRIWLGPVIGRYDRAWAHERRWAGFISDTVTTMATWSAGVRNGWRPVQLFNVTLHETGERMIIAPVIVSHADSSARGSAPGREFLQLYPHHDVEVVTAARLSATFPYVTPQARPHIGREFDSVAYYAADGGYHDNSGILTALEALEQWVSWQQYNGAARRIALIEIRAGGEPDAHSRRRPTRGRLLHSMTGPLNTMLNVRTATQVERGRSEIALTRRAWQGEQRPMLRHFVFRLSGGSPLSWHLTTAESDAIKYQWPLHETPPGDSLSPAIIAARDDNLRELNSLVAFLRPK